MKHIMIHRAGAIADEQPEEVTLTIVGEPSDKMSLKDAAIFYDEEAKKLVETLCTTLPGGTLDRVIGNLLLKHASLFRIPHTWGTDEMKKYVLITETDLPGKPEEGRPTVFEQRLDGKFGTLTQIKEFQQSLHGRYGNTRIAKLQIMEE